MKKTCLITATILIVALWSTKLYAQTTLEEYNYMTKGYQIQIASGLDMKKGYSTGTTISITEGRYIFNFIPLQKNGATPELIGYIVKAKSGASGLTYWYGLPLGDIELLNKSFASIKNLDYAMTIAFFKAYMRLQTNLF